MLRVGDMKIISTNLTKKKKNDRGYIIFLINSTYQRRNGQCYEVQEQHWFHSHLFDPFWFFYEHIKRVKKKQKTKTKITSVVKFYEPINTVHNKNYTRKSRPVRLEKLCYLKY